MARFQVLSLIGGGIRGSFSTALLYELEQRLGRRIAESFDLIAGTSTGGIIAAGLAMGLSAEEMHQFYVDYGAKIFSPRTSYRAKGLMRPLYPIANWIFKKKTGNSLDALFQSRFCPVALKEAFDIGFGDQTLGDIDFTRLIIPTVNLSKGEPYVFRTCHLPRGMGDKDTKLSDVVIAATAAPTYFPYHTIENNNYIDGGVWSSDPSVLAFAEATRVKQFENELSCCRECDTTTIHLLSIGTGRSKLSLAPPKPDPGQIYWAKQIADVMGTSQVEGIHFPLKFLLGDRYRHINFEMKVRFPLDAVEHMQDFFDSGTKAADENFDWLNDEFFGHTKAPFSRCNSSENACQIEDFSF